MGTKGRSNATVYVIGNSQFSAVELVLAGCFMAGDSSTSPRGLCLSDSANRPYKPGLVLGLHDTAQIVGPESSRVSAAIVIPAFNAASTIVETLRAVQA